MSLHGALWRVHTTELDNLDLIKSALAWISGENSNLIIDKDKSIHGAVQKTLTVKLEKKKQAIRSFKNLGNDALLNLLDSDINSRIDEDNNFHIRINLGDLVQQKITISPSNSSELIVKGIFKIECYPGDIAEIIMKNLILQVTKYNEN